MLIELEIFVEGADFDEDFSTNRKITIIGISEPNSGARLR